MDAGFVRLPHCRLASECHDTVNGQRSKFATPRLLTGNTLKVNKFGRVVSYCHLQYFLGSNARGRQRKRRQRAIDCISASSKMQAISQGAGMMASCTGVTMKQKLRSDGAVAERWVCKDGTPLHRSSLATSRRGKSNMRDLDVDDVHSREFLLFSWLRVLQSQERWRGADGSPIITDDQPNQERCGTALINRQTTRCFSVAMEPEVGGPEEAHPECGHRHHLDDDTDCILFYVDQQQKQQQMQQQQQQQMQQQKQQQKQKEHQLGTRTVVSRAGMDIGTSSAEETRNVAMPGNCMGQEVIAGIRHGHRRRHAIASLIGIAMGLASSGTMITPQTARAQPIKIFTNIEEAKEAGDKIREEKARELGPVLTLPSGVRYRESREGTGEAITLGSICSVYYTVYKLNGYYLDSSGYGNEGKDDVGETFTFQYGGGKLAKGVQLGMTGMKMGGKRRILVPPDLGWIDDSIQPRPTTFSAQRRISNLRRQPLIFEVELVKIRQP